MPREVWRSGFNAFKMADDSVVTFDSYGRQRDHPDFVRDFNLACSRQPHLSLINTKTGDEAHVNKGFLDSLSPPEAEDDDCESGFAYLASSESLNADETDFSDPAALLRRQRMILEKIEEHKASISNVNFDPLKLLKRTSQSQAEEEAEENKVD